MYLGLDIGTSSIKALLMDDEQSIIASASAGIEVSGVGCRAWKDRCQVSGFRCQKNVPIMGVQNIPRSRFLELTGRSENQWLS